MAHEVEKTISLSVFEEVKKNLELGLEKLIPSHVHNGIREYVLSGRPTGSFLAYVFSNDFIKSFQHADMDNKRVLENYVWFMMSHMPVGSFGSEKNVKEWKAHSGLKGLVKS